MQKLIRGIHQFQRGAFRPLKGLFEQLAKGQRPETLFITCSDSRIDPSLLTQSQPGDLFILRNAGNIVPPVGPGGGGGAATIEFAVAALGVKDIIICGHSHCGAMRGLLELMASQDASIDEMFTAAKYANTFWFPQQAMELAIFFKVTRGIDFAEVDARQLVGAEVSSGSGFQTIHQWLAENNLLDQVPGSDSNCGV